MKRSLDSAGMGHLFVVPFFQPPPTLGLQFVDYGNGGPSGDVTIKQSTVVPAATMVGFCGEPVVQQYLHITPMPLGIPRTRPANPDVAYGQANTATPLTYIRGIMKQPG